MKKALICGISGQDGAYLSQFLLNKGYSVIGTSRDAQVNNFKKLDVLGIKKEIKYCSMTINDFRSVLQVIDSFMPDEIYNLAGQSSVAMSFELPMETMESINIGTLNLLEAIKFLGNGIKFYNAGSGECFGERKEDPAKETDPFNPRSPYAVAKSSAYWATCNYRDAYGIYASNGILFNHESPLRPSRFVTKKVISTAVRIHKGSKEKLFLGNIDIKRDWGWAPEYVEAMWRILQHSEPSDFIIATGISNSLSQFISSAFSLLNLDWKEHTIIKSEFLRPSDLSCSKADPSKAKKELSWEAKYRMEDVVQKMLDYEIEHFEL